MNTTYVAVFNQLTSARAANDICRRLYNGSLAPVTSQYLFDGISEQIQSVAQHNNDVAERLSFWTCGRLGYQQLNMMGVVNMNSPPSFQQGLDNSIRLR